MDITQALRLVNRPDSPRNTSTSERSPSSDRNLDLIYLSGGVPIVRIEAWLACHRQTNPTKPETAEESEEDRGKEMCRDLAIVSCVYGNHLTVGFTAGRQLDGSPGTDLILNAMLQQVRRVFIQMGNF